MRTSMAYPAAERRPEVDELHGHRVADPYRWLEDPADPRTVRWLAAQDRLWAESAAELPARRRFRERVAALSDVGLVTPPVWRGDRMFHERREAGQEHPVLYLTVDGAERAVLDPMALDPGGTTVLDRWQPDPSGRLLAFQLSRRGTERSVLYVLDLDADVPVDEPIIGCRNSPVAWTGDGFVHVRADPATPAARRVYLHRIGTPVAEDVPVLGEGLPDGTAYGLGIDGTGRRLVISAMRPGVPGNDVWLADLVGPGADAAPGAAPGSVPGAASVAVPVPYRVQRAEDAGGATTVLDVGRDGRLYVVTTLGAPRGRLCVTTPDRPEPCHWTELVRAGEDEVLGDFALLDGPDGPALVVRWTSGGVAGLTVHDATSGRRTGTVDLPGEGTVGRLSTRDGGPLLWFGYTDGATPGQVLRYDVRTGRTEPWATAPGAAALPAVRTTRTRCRSADGTEVPMTVLAPAGAAAGPRPTILYGYGGFGRPLLPSYSAFTLAWVAAGGVFVTANVRGGGEGGADWHRAGTLGGKQAAVDDFVAAAEALLARGVATPGTLGLCGESNGGLLVGAAITRRPELFAAAVCSAPLLDMVRYERFGLGPSWRAEYGSADDPVQLGHLLGYSPYHRVRPGVDYPAVLLTVFGGDTRVDPMHARKMCAALQHASPRRPVLLRHEDGVGHVTRAVSRGVDLAADILAFLAAHTGCDG
ncbi:MAG TPA: prolyl oligopeptidase family serine peptidase [Pseudonocardiaceae bacterium]